MTMTFHRLIVLDAGINKATTMSDVGDNGLS